MSERLTVGECMGCGRLDITPVYIIDGAPVALCSDCRTRQQDAERAERERRLLAEWGTIGQKRTA